MAQYQMGGRRGGKTWAMVNEARDGDILVVAHHAEKEHVRRMLMQQGRKPDAVRLVSLDEHDPAVRLAGTPRDRRAYIDHGAAALAARDRGARNDLHYFESWAEQRFGGVLYYPSAEPCDTGRQGSPHSAKADAAGVTGASDAG